MHLLFIEYLNYFILSPKFMNITSKLENRAIEIENVSIRLRKI